MRFTQEANVQLFGDRNVAMQYIGLARKLLGELQTYNHDLSPITREGVTSRTHKTPDGALIQVIWFPWQPVIKIFPPGVQEGAERRAQERRAQECYSPDHYFPFEDGRYEDVVGGWTDPQGGFQIAFGEGRIGDALVGGSFQVGPPDFTDLAEYKVFTVAWWFKLVRIHTAGARKSVVNTWWGGYQDQPDFGFFNMYLEANGEIFMYADYWSDAQDTYWFDYHTYTPPVGEWQHCALTNDGTQMNFYVGGAHALRFGQTDWGPGTGKGDFATPFPGDYLNITAVDDVVGHAHVDDFAVWTKVLPVQAIQKLAAGTPASELCV